MKLMVLDGNSLINRAYHGVRPLSTSQGLQTNAISVSSPPSSG